MEKDKTLLDLPVYPEDRDLAGTTDIIVCSYIEEMNKVSSAEELVAFTQRWRNLFLLKKDDEILFAEEEQIITGAFDSASVYEAFLRKNSKDLDLDDPAVKVMMNIAAPRALIWAYVLGRRYGVGSDLAMVRLYLDPHSEFEDHLRG